MSKRFECSECDLIFASNQEKPPCVGCNNPDCVEIAEAPARTPKYKKPVKEGPVCLTPECGKPAEWKGLCRSCYGCAKRVMEKENLKWDDLGRMGLCANESKPFYAAFAKKRAELEKPEQAAANGLGGTTEFKGPTYRG